MLSKGYLIYFKVALKICNLGLAVPYEWDTEFERLRILKSWTLKLFYKMQLFFQFGYNLIMLINLLLNFKSESFSLTNKLVGSLFSSIYTMMGVCKLNYFLFETEGLKLINGVFAFEGILLKGYSITFFYKLTFSYYFLINQTRDIVLFIEHPSTPTNGSNVAKFVFVLGTQTGFFFPCLISLLLIVKPCSLPFLGSLILEKSFCNNDILWWMDNSIVAVRIILAIFEFWMWLP